MISHLDIQDRFFAEAKEMRRAVVDRFADPKKPKSDRFVWDYWNVEGQYSLLRTPAERFFPKALTQKFYDRLLEFGREELGCAGISPPWLSIYIDGCYQDFHTDVPHGPWAYVFSLTDWVEREFSGGETLLLNPDVLSYWESPRSWAGAERERLIESIPPQFNRLTVFDPRIPHGVARVSGVREPSRARIVVHGWFTNPQPFVEGALTRKQVAKAIDPFLDVVQQAAAEASLLDGFLCLRFKVRKDGTFGSPKVIAENLRPANEARDHFLQIISHAARKISFPKSRGETRLTLPILLR